MKILPRLNAKRWYARLPIKWTLLGLTALAVCYPFPGLLLRHVRHWENPDALIEPNAPALQPLVKELRAEITPDLKPGKALALVERFVYAKVPYEWDWNTWGVADYLPTVAEVMEKGHEDCDGRAVVAASLLRNLGFKSEIVTDFAHVWVKTDHGEAMGPGKTKAVVATDHGLTVNWRGLANLPASVAYGVAVFPALREWIVLVMLWLLLLRTDARAVRSGAALAFLGCGLHLLRAGGADYYNSVPWMQWTGATLFAVGFAVSLLTRRQTPSRSTTTTVPDAVEIV